MRLDRNSAFLGIGVILTSLICRVGWQNEQTEDARPEAVHSRFTSERILDKTTALFSTITPLTATTTYSAEYFTLSPGRHIWIVDCRNRSHRPIGQFRWDADTGQLLGVLCTVPNASPLTSCNARYAAVAAGDWLRALQAQGSSQLWRLAATPAYAFHHWTAVFRGQDHSTMIQMDEAGTLTAINTWPRLTKGD